MLDPNYPRPQFARHRWQSLDGIWAFADCDALNEKEVTWTQEIQVPYPPESVLSGIHDPGYHPVVWYRRSFQIPEAWHGDRIILHFGAVDYSAEVWVNGHLVTRHEGGHTPFSANITEVLETGDQVVTVRAEDDPLDLAKPRGKQDWLPEPHAIWYPRTTGIWQSVWLEPLPQSHLSSVRFTPDMTNFGITTEVELEGATEELSLDITFKLGDTLLAADNLQLTEREVKRVIYLPDPGIDDARQRFLWSPEHPNLIDVELVLRRGKEVIDEVKSYTAMRTVEARAGTFYLNARPYFLRLVLDQGYWNESLLAAPSAEALRKDVELAKAMGFNGVRKHQKIEDPRYLYWADKLGLLVWEELASAYRFSPEATGRLTKEWLEVVDRDRNHPCIVAWVIFNESWGVPDLPSSASQRHLVQALYHLTKSLDPSRPVVGNDGWEHVISDLLTIHDYSSDPEALNVRYGNSEACKQTATTFHPAGRNILLDGMVKTDQPVILSEFGGIRLSSEITGWGYDQADSQDSLLEKYQRLIIAASSRGLAGFCYTQFSDTFQEQNGLLYADRQPKVSLSQLAKATRGGG